MDLTDTQHDGNSITNFSSKDLNKWYSCITRKVLHDVTIFFFFLYKLYCLEWMDHDSEG